MNDEAKDRTREPDPKPGAGSVPSRDVFYGETYGTIRLVPTDNPNVDAIKVEAAHQFYGCEGVFEAHDFVCDGGRYYIRAGGVDGNCREYMPRTVTASETFKVPIGTVSWGRMADSLSFSVDYDAMTFALAMTDSEDFRALDMLLSDMRVFCAGHGADGAKA